jgi:hypothetical protein
MTQTQESPAAQGGRASRIALLGGIEQGQNSKNAAPAQARRPGPARQAVAR